MYIHLLVALLISYVYIYVYIYIHLLVALLISIYIYIIYIVIYIRREGFQEGVDENWAVFIGCWCLTWPFVIFQSLLCAYDSSDGGSPSNLTHTEILIPMLLLLGWATLSACGMAYHMTTNFEAARPQKLSTFSGIYDIYNV